MLRNTDGISYAISRPETPTRPDNADELLAERLDAALGEIADDPIQEAVDPEETILGFFRRIVANADGQ